MNVTPWRRCCYCGKVVRINKPLFGSMHVCLTEEEIRLVDARHAQLRYQQHQQAMDRAARQAKQRP